MNNDALFVSTTLASWKLVNDRLDKAFAAFSDEDLQREVAPGKNRIFYLLGHLVAVHDLMLPLLRLGDRLHPELDKNFLSNPDRTFPDEVSAGELRNAWAEVNAALAEKFAALPPAEWLERHNSVSEEDFAKEPLRCRLAVLLSRTNHAASHHGQIQLVK